MIDVINLEKSFGNNKVLKGINITIEKGDIMVVIGPSGSGKSTFLRCLNCMEDPTGGQGVPAGPRAHRLHRLLSVHSVSAQRGDRLHFRLRLQQLSAA